MSKQISDKELAEIISNLLTDTDATGELCDANAFQGFMTDIARVVCDYCGGEVHNPADLFDGAWYVRVRGNDSLPFVSDGIWGRYDPEGELYTEGSPEWFEAQYGPGGHPIWERSGWQHDVGNGDTQLGYWEWVAHNAESEAAEERGDA